MSRLKSKTFLVLWILLTLFSMIIMFIFNYQLYEREYNEIENNLLRISNFQNMIGSSDRLPFFVDAEAYVVYFDRGNKIDRIVSYTPSGLGKEEIINIAIKYINKKTSTNLYTSDYVYKYNGNSLLILGNSEVKNLLNIYLRISIIIFLVFEMINIYISYKLTGWLLSPVIETFDKQKQFIYDVSHELKTPIAVIMANADMVDKNPNEKKWVNNIKNESDRMNKLVVSLLDLLMSDNINERDKFSKINISKTIEMSVLTFESLIYENDLKLDYEIDDNIYFNCNVERIKQLFGILVDNAIKHAKKDSKITIMLKKEKDNIYLSVKNRGDSIPKKDRDKIFERFYRSDKSRNRDENRYGLGLAIAKSIVNVHGGKICVNCNAGYTTFIVNFKN